MFGLGTPELLLILVLVLVLFGGNRIPALGKAVGEGIAGFLSGLRPQVHPKGTSADESRSQPGD